MNARERADKILNYINGEFGVNPSVTGDQSNLEFIAAAIEEAEREAVERDQRYALDVSGFVKKARLEGFSAAREQAKGMFSHKEFYSGEYISEKIEAMKPDGEGV